MTIGLNGILIIAVYTALRLGIPILAMVVLCKVLPHLCPGDSVSQGHQEIQ